MVKNCTIKLVKNFTLYGIIYKMQLRGKKMKILNHWIKKINRTSLKTQLSILIITSFSIVIVSIIAYMYKSNSNTIVEQETSKIGTLLNLETENLDTYLSEIERYSLLLRNDQDFMRIINTKYVMTYVELAKVQSLLRSNFDSRNDLISYRLFLINKSTNYYMDSTKRKVQPFYDNSVENLPNYSEFIKGKYYRSIQPALEENQFIIFYRTIINIEDQKPLAIVELTFDTSYIESLANSYQESNERFFVIDENNQMLYSNKKNILKPSDVTEILNHLSTFQVQHMTKSINDEDYLIVYNESKLGLYKALTIKPIIEIDEKIIYTRNVSLMLGLFALSVTTFLAILFIKLVTKPLSTLAYRLREVGTGNFTTTIAVGGSSEIANLAQNYNLMIRQIDDLIKKTYLSELNEKTARLIALEAQLNPHFLYNTLQAISAEAVVNEQFRINYMITALASMLRYTIKGNEFVTLEDEMKHVMDYLLLQQSRFEDNLTYEIQTCESNHSPFIPKICIQTLVENSIIHGMKGEIAKIHLIITSVIENETLIITVSDNGNGIEKDKLLELKSIFSNSTNNQQKSANIGLLNLWDRLRLIYENKAQLIIDSIPQEITTITLIIPVEKEFPNV